MKIDIDLGIKEIQDYIYYELPDDELKDFILDLDERIGDFDFTVDLIETLYKSIKKDDPDFKFAFEK